MAHINDLYEQQAKDLLHKLCDALGIEQDDRTRAKVEAAIASRNKSRFCVYTGISFSGGGWIELSKEIEVHHPPDLLLDNCVVETRLAINHSLDADALVFDATVLG